jgi:hypothetical protein
MGSALTRHRVTIRQHTRLSPLFFSLITVLFPARRNLTSWLAFLFDSNNDKITPFAFPKGCLPHILHCFWHVYRPQLVYAYMDMTIYIYLYV